MERLNSKSRAELEKMSKAELVSYSIALQKTYNLAIGYMEAMNRNLREKLEKLEPTWEEVFHELDRP